MWIPNIYNGAEKEGLELRALLFTDRCRIHGPFGNLNNWRIPESEFAILQNARTQTYNIDYEEGPFHFIRNAHFV